MNTPRLALAVHDAVVFVLVRPHYPENVGAAARAIKTMGFRQLVLVKPGKLAAPDHEMALKMAVKSRDVLTAARVVASLREATVDAGLVIATTSRRGVSGILEPRRAAQVVLARVAAGERVAILFGNEKTGLAQEEVSGAGAQLRIPMAADQPSINLAQATQLVAYELFVAALERRSASG